MNLDMQIQTSKTERHSIFSIISYAKYIGEERITKIILIIAFVFITSTLIIIERIPPASGYEISIYNAYPTMFWFFMLSSIIISIYIIIISAISNSKYWVYGLLALFICYTVILFLPSLRGYLFLARGGSDIFIHLGYIRTTIQLESVSIDNFYPITHILAVNLNLVTSLPIRRFPDLFSVFFSFLYIASFFLLGKAILKNNRGGLFMLAFASPLMYSILHKGFMPFFFALSSIPLILYCFHKKKFQISWEFSLLTLILSFNVVFFHPFIVIILLITFIVFGIYFVLKNNTDYNRWHSNVINVLGVLIVSFVSWFFAFESLLNNIERIINSLFSTGETTIYEYQTNLIESSDASISLIIERFLKIYGSISLYFLLALLCLIIVFRRKNTAKDIEKIYGLLFICAILFGIFQAITYAAIFEPIRISSFAIITATAFLGLVSYSIFEKAQTANKRKLIVVCMITVICSVSVLSVLNIYQSPWNGGANLQMTQMEASGLDWFLGNTHNSIHVINKYNPISKYKLYKSTFNNNYGSITEDVLMPTHFGYDLNNTLSKTVGNNDMYMITSEFVRKSYLSAPENRHLLIPRYLETDFWKLNNDPTVNKIYLNGEFEVWSIFSKL